MKEALLCLLRLSLLDRPSVSPLARDFMEFGGRKISNFLNDSTPFYNRASPPLGLV